MLGLTAEGLYRAANKRAAATIDVDEFKAFLRGSRLGLSQGQATRIAYMADEECNGQISYADWVRLLETYEIATETSNLEGSGQQPKLSQQSMLKLANLVSVTLHKSPESVFEEIA
jgi:hypothetical protein